MAREMPQDGWPIEFVAKVLEADPERLASHAALHRSDSGLARGRIKVSGIRFLLRTADQYGCTSEAASARWQNDGQPSPDDRSVLWNMRLDPMVGTTRSDTLEPLTPRQEEWLSRASRMTFGQLASAINQAIDEAAHAEGGADVVGLETLRLLRRVLDNWIGHNADTCREASASAVARLSGIDEKRTVLDGLIDLDRRRIATLRAADEAVATFVLPIGGGTTLSSPKTRFSEDELRRRAEIKADIRRLEKQIDLHSKALEALAWDRDLAEEERRKVANRYATGVERGIVAGIGLRIDDLERRWLLLPWRLLPGATAQEVKDHLLRHWQQRGVEIDHGRLDFFRSLTPPPTQFCAGLDGFDGYVACVSDLNPEAAFLECPAVGNAIYVIRRDWKRLSKLPRRDQRDLHSDSVCRIVHGPAETWKREVRRLWHDAMETSR